VACAPLEVVGLCHGASLRARRRTGPGEFNRAPNRGGRKAFAVWRPLSRMIESRWQNDSDGSQLKRCARGSPRSQASLIRACLILFPFLATACSASEQQAPKGATTPVAERELSLPGLLSKVLFAFALEFEQQSEVSLAIAANVLRLTGEAGVPVRHLPRLSGVSKEAIAMAVSWLEKHDWRAWGRSRRAAA